MTRYLIGKKNAYDSNPYVTGCQKPYACYSIVDERAQGPKTIVKSNKMQPRDPTAYSLARVSLRGRSLHSSSVMAGTKVGTSNHRQFARTMSPTVRVTENSTQRGKGSNPEASVGTWLQAGLDKLRKKDNKYYGLVNILADPEFLKYCYLEIRSKPGNMTTGSLNTTLDGISEKWFTQTAEAIKSGKYRFAPGRKVLIPKPGKTERRTLGVGGPREKIVQKALTMILQVI